MTTSWNGTATVPPPPAGARTARANEHETAAPAVPLPPVVPAATPPRQWRPKWVVAAVVVVLLGGVVAMYALQHFNRRDSVLAIARPVSVGSVITAADLSTAQVVADAHLSPIPASQQQQVVGKIASVDLTPGTLLTASEVTTSDGFSSGQVLVTLPLKQTQLPARGVRAGELIEVVATGSADAATGSGAAGAGGQQSPAQTPIPATVLEVGAPDPTSGVVVVDVRVGTDLGVGLSQLAASGDMAIIVLPGGR